MAATGEVELDLEGITVLFPFQPYDVQVNYMRAAVRALQRTSNALLESPTGTGKTLCLLCATLAWYVHNKPTAQLMPAGGELAKKRTIVYASRTHAQLAQVVREFKRTAYSRLCRMAILGSREHLCVNRDVMKLPTSAQQNGSCNALRASRSCRYFFGISQQLQHEERDVAMTGQGNVGLFDIEDLVKSGQKNAFCPYFYERELAASADIVFLPYTYVLDPSLAKQLPFELDNAILLLDEAHNIPGYLGSSTSITFAPADLPNAISDATRAYEAMLQDLQKRDADWTPNGPTAAAVLGGAADPNIIARAENVAALKVVLCNLEKEIEAFTWSGAGVEDGGDIALPGTFMREFLPRARIDERNVVEVLQAIDDALQALANTDTGARGLNKVRDFLSRVYDTSMDDAMVNEAFRFVVTKQRVREGRSRVYQRDAAVTRDVRVLGYWCLDTAVAMRLAVRQVSCMLLTSGTLSPMEHFAAELGVGFPIQHTGAHVVDESQVRALIMCRGPKNQILEGSYDFRNSQDYRLNLGLAIVNLVRVVPDGALVFFPSYAAMNATIEWWRTTPVEQNKTLWGMLADLKTLFVEPSDSSELPVTVQMFQAAVDEHKDGKGALLFAVARGKVSEGIDFADRHGRAVIMTGIPFANSADLEVKLKKRYFTSVADKRPRVNGKLFTGEDWYRNEALRTVNQCIGRVIRHKDDFGVVVLADNRFCRFEEAISPWMRRSLSVQAEFRDVYRAVVQFFAPRRAAAQPPARPQPAGNPNSSTAGLLTGLRGPSFVPDSAGAARLFAANAVTTAPTTDDTERIGVSTVNRVAAAPLGLVKAEVQRNGGASPPQSSSGQPGVPPLRRDPNKPIDAAEYTSHVRARLPPADYAKFKGALHDILKIVRVADKAQRSQQLAVAVDVIRTTLCTLSDGDQLVRDFGGFVPEGLRAEFAQLTRKRSR